MNHKLDVEQFLAAIRRLPSDPPSLYPGKWYQTQKEHWIGWLSEYHSPGAYDRTPDPARDARYVYNHIVEPAMLLWLIDAAGVDRQLVSQAKHDASQAKSMMQQSAIIRRIVPWAVVARALWPS
jgi:hypothetical protein